MLRQAPPSFLVRALSLALALALTGCERLSRSRPARLELTLGLPRTRVDVLLNEPIVLYFDGELERASVTSSSVRIVDPEGREAPGRFEVSGKSVRFLPAPVYAPTLDDGGFRPGTTYLVELAGFPDPGALRGIDGAPLARPLRWSFRTVAIEPAGAGPAPLAFQDATPERGSAIGLASGTIGSREPLYLRAGEPLDPSSLRSEDFRLRRRAGEGSETVAVRTRLVPAPPLASPLGQDEEARWVELVPLQPLAPGAWRLEIDPRLRLRDYGGNPIWAPSSAEGLGFDLRVAPEPSLARGRYDETFLAPDRRSPLPPPELQGEAFDGTAHWGRSGVAGVRLPAAVGDGHDGEVRLVAREPRRDLHATRMRLEAGEECALDPAPGLVVLRAQGRLQIDGRLVRACPDAVGRGPAFPGRTLSEWLSEAAAPVLPEEGEAAAPRSWTVLVAGGDLVVAGELEVEGPLLLVAGGVVRVTGRVQAPSGGVAMLGEGGGSAFHADRAELVLDEPERNPLVTTLRLGVLSQSIPPRGRVDRWLDSEARGHAGAGRWRVRFLEADTLADPPGARMVHDTPRLFDRSSTIAFLVELEVGPGAPRALWDPPFVDEVSVTWEEATH